LAISANLKAWALASAISFALAIDFSFTSWITFTLLDNFTKWSYWVCYLIALILSVVWNFTLNREFTFKSANNVPVAMFKVFLFYLVFTPTTTWLGNYLVETIKWNAMLVTVLIMISNFVLEYLYDRFYVFGNSLDTKKRG
jgi:putative flippase GtrA